MPAGANVRSSARCSGPEQISFEIPRPLGGFALTDTEYDEWDLFPLGHTERFNQVLESLGPYPVDEIWNRHKGSLSPQATLVHGGWKWWSGQD
jgi:hypothetical protein